MSETVRHQQFIEAAIKIIGVAIILLMAFAVDGIYRIYDMLKILAGASR